VRILVKDLACLADVGVVPVEIAGATVDRARPKLFIMEQCRLGCPLAGKEQLPVRVLLDTGNDITIVRPESVKALEALLEVDIQPAGNYPFYASSGEPEPAYLLTLAFAAGDVEYYSTHHFIAPANWDFDVADVWLGQDIFSQLCVTFDGPAGTVTIVDPGRPPRRTRRKRTRRR
jgi:hypothetical protein